MMNKYGDLRQDYSRSQLVESEVSSDPLAQFDLWFHEAIDGGVLEPNAFILSTVSVIGLPSARVILLKGVDQKGFVFYTNYHSDKAKDLKVNPGASMVFMWLSMERQIRITGDVSMVTREESEAYFHSRPRESQIGAWVSPQSDVIASRDVLDQQLLKYNQQFEDRDVIPLPDHWGGYRLIPSEVEFWQGRPNRLHDRLLYTLHDQQWKIERLAP
ncbi:MAG: pyridoxamine 5'-phosphate oxidase [Saprospiraceae bacterium]